MFASLSREPERETLFQFFPFQPGCGDSGTNLTAHLEMAKKVATRKAAAKKTASKPARKTTAGKAAKSSTAKKKTEVKKAAGKKVAVKKSEIAKKAEADKRPEAEKTTAKKFAVVSLEEKKRAALEKVEAIKKAAAEAKMRKPAKLTPFLKKQQKRLLDLRDTLVDAMAGVAQDNLRSRAEGSEASAFGMHQADAGSDAYDRDFALNLLSQEQDALYEIEEAIKRVDEGSYGVCEKSGKNISKARLEAIPFARLTVECQAEVEKEQRNGYQRQSVRSLFGLNDEDRSELTNADALEEDK